METEDLVPKLLLFGGLTAVVVFYSRRRAQHAKKLATVAESGAAMAASTATAIADQAPTLVARGQSMLESVLDSVADQALRELKGVLKDGLKKLEAAVDSL